MFVDQGAGLLTSCDADTKMLIYTSSGCKFKEIIFIFFCNKQAQEQVATLQRF